MKWLATAGLALLLTLMGCTSTVGDGNAPARSLRSERGPEESASETERTAAARCDVRSSAPDARNVVTVRDLDPAASGGASITDADYRHCAPMTAPLGWRCDLAFPWQTAAVTGEAMATLGVTRARVSYVVTPGRTFTETILEVDPEVSSGVRVLRALARACPPKTRVADGEWVRFGPDTAALATGPIVMAVDFTDGSWREKEKSKVLRAAVAALGR